VNGDLHVELIRDAKATIDRCRGRSPIFVQLQPDGAGPDLVSQAGRQCRIALAGEAEVQRQVVHGLKHLTQIERAGRAGRRACPDGWPGAPADHGGQAGGDGFISLLRTDEVNVRIEATRGKDQALAGDDFGRDSDHHFLRDPGHHVRIARLANARNQAAFDADVGLIDSRVVEDQGVGDDTVERIRVTDARRLSHALANNFAAAKLAFVAIGREVFLDLKNERSVAQPHFIPRGRAEHLGVMTAFHFVRHNVAIGWRTSVASPASRRPSCQRRKLSPSPGCCRRK
jgi:hypothetical protein